MVRPSTRTIISSDTSQSRSETLQNNAIQSIGTNVGSLNKQVSSLTTSIHQITNNITYANAVDIVDISKIESGQMMVNLSDLNVNSILDDLFDFFKEEATKKSIKLGEHFLAASICLFVVLLIEKDACLDAKTNANT